MACEELPLLTEHFFLELQGGVPVLVCDVEVCPCPHQQPHNAHVLPLHRHVQLGMEIEVLKIKICLASVNKELGNFDMIVEAGQMKCSVSVIFLLIHNPRSRQLGE